MSSVDVKRVPEGYVVSRVFATQAAAQRGTDLLMSVNEAAFEPAGTLQFECTAGEAPPEHVVREIVRAAYDAHPFNPVSQATGD